MEVRELDEVEGRGSKDPIIFITSPRLSSQMLKIQYGNVETCLCEHQS